MTRPKTETGGTWRAATTSAALLVLLGTVGFIAAREFLSMRTQDGIFPSAGLTSQRKLSAYLPSLAGSPGDTDIYVFEGKEPGGRVLVLGGTHPNEPAGMVAAVALIENLRLDRGTVFVIPRANNSGFTHSDPHEASPQRFSLDTPSGPRSFRLGSRVTNPVHQWPDPTIYVNPAGQALAGIEARNLNRAYPGQRRGNLTERVAFAVMELIRRERVDLGIDLHESAPEYPVINALVFHENAADLAALAQMSLEGQGLNIRLEASPPNLRGLSHREWGDAAGIMAVLLETPNASHGRLKGKPTPSLVVDGRDELYVRAARLGRLFVPFGPEGIPLKDRVARHLAGVQALLAGLGDLLPDKAVAASAIPEAGDVRERGVGAYLRGPAGKRP
jgi:predicted deacylase